MVDEIEALAPGGFTDRDTGNAPELKIISGGIRGWF